MLGFRQIAHISGSANGHCIGKTKGIFFVLESSTCQMYYNEYKRSLSQLEQNRCFISTLGSDWAGYCKIQVAVAGPGFDLAKTIEEFSV